MPSDSETTPPTDPQRPQPDDLEAGERRVAEFGRPSQPVNPPPRRVQPTAGRPFPPPGQRPMPGSRGVPPVRQSYDQPFLRNPYVLAGLAVGGAMVLAVLVVFIFGSSGSGSANDDDAGVVVDPLTPGPGRGVTARSVSTSTVREGPGLEFVALGELSRNQEVEVVGRNDEGTWFNVYFPPGSSFRGWVHASVLRLPGNSAIIPIVSVTPVPRPTVIQPTTAPEPTGTTTLTPSPTGTSTPSAGSDLAASIVPGTCAVGSRLIVNIRNLGPAPITSRAIAVLVQATDGSQRALATQTATIPPGGQIDIDTTYVVQERVVATIDPLQTLGDPNTSNNRVDCVVSGVPTIPGGATPTRTPTSAVPPPIATSTRTPNP